MLRITNLNKSFGKRLLFNQVNCTFPEGINVLVGLNGSGKSTLIKMIAGIETQDTGEFHLYSHSLGFLPPEERHVGYVPQHSALFPNLTVEENVKYALKNRRGSPASVEEAVELMEIGQYLKAKPHQLSGGYQSRVALARALAAEPKALLLDEPLSDMDIHLKARLIPQLKNILNTRKIPIVYVTHDPNEAEMLGTFFFEIKSNTIVKVDNTEK